MQVKRITRRFVVDIPDGVEMREGFRRVIDAQGREAFLPEQVQVPLYRREAHEYLASECYDVSEQTILAKFPPNTLAVETSDRTEMIEIDG
jgi:hypothetical protein